MKMKRKPKKLGHHQCGISHQCLGKLSKKLGVKRGNLPRPSQAESEEAASSIGGCNGIGVWRAWRARRAAVAENMLLAAIIVVPSKSSEEYSKYKYRHVPLPHIKCHHRPKGILCGNQCGGVRRAGREMQRSRWRGGVA